MNRTYISCIWHYSRGKQQLTKRRAQGCRVILQEAELLVSNKQ